jgi:hypothetical protein
MDNAAPEIRSIWPNEQTDAPVPLLRPRRHSLPERGIGLRAATIFPVLFCEGPHAAHCHAVELSASGIVVERGRELSAREQRAGVKLELFLPGVAKSVRVLAKVIRPVGFSSYALKFVLISDVDRLTLMEHLDRERVSSLQLLEEIEGAA